MFIKKFSKLFILAIIVTSAFSLSDSNVEASGSWSSYGRLAYVSFDESSTPDRDIVVWDADTDWENGRKFLVRLDGILDQGECNQRDPSLSPNGKWLAFATDCDFYGYNPNFKYWIAAINLEDTSEWYPMTIGREKNSNFNARNPTWNPTGSKLAFDSDVQGGNSQVYYINFYDQIGSSASGKIDAFKKIGDRDQMWDPYFSPDGDFFTAMTPEGAVRVWPDGITGVSLSKHKGDDIQFIGSPIVIRGDFGSSDQLGTDVQNYWRIPGLMNDDGTVNCDPRAEVFAYHTTGWIPGDGEHGIEDDSEKIIVTCEHSLDDESPEYLTSRQAFATNTSHKGGTGCCTAAFPEVSPAGEGIAYITRNGQIMVKRYIGDNYESGHFADNSNVSIAGMADFIIGQDLDYRLDLTDGSPISWSFYEKGLSEGEGALEIGVGAIGLKVDVGGGVNDIFKQEESLEDQYDKQVQLEIDRINSYIAELEYIKQSELKMLDFDIDQYMQKHNQNIAMNNSAIEGIIYEQEFNRKDLLNRHAYDLNDFDENTEYEYQWKKEELANWEINEAQRSLAELEADKIWDEDQIMMRYSEGLQNIDYDYQNKVKEINNRWDDYLVYLDGYWNDIIQQNIQDGDQEAIDYHNKRKTRDKQDTETTRQRELEDAFNENQRSIWDTEDSKTFEINDLQNRFVIDKENLIRNNENEKARREQNLINFSNDRETDRSAMLERHSFELEDFNLRAESATQDVKMNIEYGNQQMNMELQRREMQWELRREQISLDYDNQLLDFQRQIDEVKYQSEMEKQRLSMDQAQLEAEMLQMQNELNSRENDVNNFYSSSIEDLKNESSFRLDEIERRKADEDWSDEKYQQELSDFDKWELEREYEIQSEFENRQRELQFDQRQYENFSTVVETNELYQDGERGFFGNPMPGTIRQGGITDNLSDPGTLAMIGIVVTVGTTFLQLFRGK